MREFRRDLWSQAAAIAHAGKYGFFFRNVSKFNCDYCPFAALCLNNITLHPQQAPTGFEILDDVHPELAIGRDGFSELLWSKP